MVFFDYFCLWMNKFVMDLVINLFINEYVNSISEFMLVI